MPHVAALYRYPVKGFTPETRTELAVQADGRIAGDRVLAFRFASDVEPREQNGLDYWPKSQGLALMDFPSLARLRLRFDDETLRVSIRDGDTELVDAALDDACRIEVSGEHRKGGEEITHQADRSNHRNSQCRAAPKAPTSATT